MIIAGCCIAAGSLTGVAWTLLIVNAGGLVFSLVSLAHDDGSVS